jgi:putative redox protein
MAHATAIIGTTNYEVAITAGHHQFNADEGADLGGRDVGPSPFELLCSALGACTAITLRMYAERHNWALHRATVELQHEKIPSADGTSMIDHLQRTIYLEGDLIEEQRHRLLQIAERCPVSETLRHPAIIDSILAAAPSPRESPQCSALAN